MGHLRKKFSGNAAEASSEPASSENRTPKSLKPKPKISRNPVIKGKKKSVLGSKKLSINTEKNDDTDQSVQKSTTGRQNEKKNRANIKFEEKGAGLENKLQSRMNKEKHGGLQKKQHLEKNKEMCSGLEKIEDGQTTEGNNGRVESQPSEKCKEKLDGLQKKRHFDKIKEKSSWFKDIEPSQTNEENHGPMESQQNAEKKEKLSGLQKKLHLDKNKEKSRWFKDIEHGQTTEGNNGQMESQQSERKKELGGLEKKQQFDKQEKSRWFKNVEHGQMNEEKHGQLASQRDEKKKEKLGGLIFMCNAKTKPDCFRYSILGLPISKKEVVLGIKPGLKLFLYDFDVKLLYGIYNASSCGGMKLEPAAFGGGFPVQVRFNVHQDCYPLPESVFRRAIKENYNGKNRFDTELTDVQVQKLIELFRPAEVLSHAPPIGPTPIPALHDTKVNEGSRESLANHHRDSGASCPRTYENGQHLAYVEVPLTEGEDLPQNYFPSETEYRTYGLRSDRQNFTPPRSQIAPTWDPHSGHVRQHLLMHPGYYLYADAAPGQLQAAHNDQHLATEKQSLTCGVFPRPELQSSIPLAATTMAYLDPYRPPSGREEVPLGSYSFSGREETYPSENDRLQRRETYLTQTDYSWRGEAYPTQTTHLGMRQNVDAGMVYSTYASNTLLEYNQINKHQGVGPESSLAPVSSRYSFAGPSLTHR